MSFPQHETILAGHYRVRAQVGYATLGWLYHAVDVRDGREVALRIVLGIRDPEAARRRLAALIDASARVGQRGLAPALGCGAYEGQLWFTSEWLNGQSLEALITNAGSVSIADAARIGVDVARTLDAAHRHGLVHRGLTTRNIFVGGERTRVLEPGVAAAVFADEPVLSNTPASMSPEQIMNGVIDRRSDIYALACCLFSAVVGRPPFDGTARSQVMAAQAGWRAPRARDLNAAVPESVELTLLRAMAARPEDRFESMDDFAAALSRWPGAIP